MSLSSDVANYSTIRPKPGVDLDTIHPALQSSFQALFAYLVSTGYGATVNSTYRSWSAQASLQGTNGAAPPGKSTHNGVDVGGAYSQAIDITIYDFDGNRLNPSTDSQLYYLLGAWWQSQPPIYINGVPFNRRWGGTFSTFDPYHFDFSGKYPTKPIPGHNNVAAPIPMAQTAPSNKPVAQVKGEALQISEGCGP